MIAAAPIIARRAVMRPSVALYADAAEVVPASAARDVVGIAAESQPKVGGVVHVVDRAGDSMTAESGGAFALDAKLTTDALGCLVTAAPGEPVVAVALQAATSAGLWVPVRLASRGLIAR